MESRLHEQGRALLLVWTALAGLSAQGQGGGPPPKQPPPEQQDAKRVPPQGSTKPADAQHKPSTDNPKTAAEDELKSAFVLQFARYVTWARDAVPGSQAITIAVVGDDNLGATMTSILKDKKVDERPIVVTNLGPFVKLADQATLKRCQVLVFAGDDATEWAAIREELGKSAVLTISTLPGFAKQGGMIELYPDGKSLRFEVVQRHLGEAELTASSKLLRLSKPRPEPPPGEVRR